MNRDEEPNTQMQRKPKGSSFLRVLGVMVGIGALGILVLVGLVAYTCSR